MNNVNADRPFRRCQVWETPSCQRATHLTTSTNISLPYGGFVKEEGTRGSVSAKSEKIESYMKTWRGLKLFNKIVGRILTQ